MLEDLPNEIILLIYSYLELSELHRAFSSLNFRFNYLLYNHLTPLYARLNSKITFPIEKYSFRINKLSLINWHPGDVLSILYQIKFPELIYLKIKSSDNSYFGRPTNDLIRRIYSFPHLCRCQIKLAPTIYIGIYDIPISQTLVHLKLSMITLDMLFYLLTRVPNLYSLNVWLNSNGRRFDSSTYDEFYNCSKLKIFIVVLHNDIQFEEVTFLLRHMPVLRSLKMFGSVWDQHFLDAQIWENILLGENFFPLLNRIHLNLSIRFKKRSLNECESLVNRFRKDLFKRTKFQVYFQQILWIDMKCSWNNTVESLH